LEAIGHVPTSAPFVLKPCFYSHFPLGKVGFNALQKKMVAQRFGIDGDELSRAKSASRMLVDDTDCPLCNTQQLTQPPLALAVPLSRFTLRVGGGSAFYVRQHPYAHISIQQARVAIVTDLAFQGTHMF
jgi:hypothetical protein